MDANHLTDQKYWVKNWSAVVHSDVSPAIRPRPGAQEFFYQFLPKRRDWSVIEIGAYPGRKLLELSLSHGYQPTAFDFLPAVLDLPPVFEKYGIPNLEAVCEDLFKHQNSTRYNVVMSFGFLEHFNDLDDVLRRHWDLVEDQGFLVIEVPSFGPLQMLLRRLILKRETLEEVLRSHNTSVMDLMVLKDACGRLPQNELVFADYIGGMRTWFHHSQSYVRKDRVWILWLWKVLGLVPTFFGWTTKAFSPNILLVVRRKA
jgi:SAM-dependent methyltransferase